MTLSGVFLRVFSEEYEDKSRKEFFCEDDNNEDEADCAVQMYNFGKNNSSKSKEGNPGRVLDTAKILERVFDLEGGRILLKVLVFFLLFPQLQVCSRSQSRGHP